MSRDAMRCRAMCSHVMSHELMSSDVMQLQWKFWACDAMWLVVRSRCVVSSGHVMWWLGRWCGDPNYKVLYTRRCGTWCQYVVGCEVRWSNGVGCDVTWGEVMWLVARCYIMSCHAMWCDVVSCHVICCDVVWFIAMSRDARRCHAMCSRVDEPWADVKWCDATQCDGCYELVMLCGWLWGHVVWLAVVMWCGELEDDVVIPTRRTTQL